MANRTVKDARNVHGTNPQYLIEKIIRSRIYDSKFWKEQCFALTAELLVDKAMEIRYVGGVFGGNIRPTPFLCLTLKMLQIQPEKDIVVEFIKNEEFKYVRALGAFYLRLTGTSLDCYKYLEPLYNDNRKLRNQSRSGQFEIQHMDEYIDELLRSDRVCDIILPRIQKRSILEENNELEPKVSALDDDLDEEMASDDELPAPATILKVSEANESPSKKRHKKERSERSRSKERPSGDYLSDLRQYEQKRNSGGDRSERYPHKNDDDRDRERDRKGRDRERDTRDRKSSKYESHNHYDEERGGGRKRENSRGDYERQQEYSSKARDYERERGGGGRDRVDDRKKHRKHY